MSASHPCADCGAPVDYRARRCRPCAKVRARALRLARRRTCADCGCPVTTEAKRCRACMGLRRMGLRSASGGALIDGTTRFGDDPRARYAVAAHPDGLTLEETGELLGLTRERVRQIEAVAIERLRRRLALAGVGEADVAEMLAMRARREVAA